MRSRKTDQLALEHGVSWLFDDEMFAGWKRHGNTTWSLSSLVTMALIWAWGDDGGLQERFRKGLTILPRLDRSGEWGGTYQGFVKVLRTWTKRLLPAVVRRLRERMQNIGATDWKICGWTVMAVDGTRIETPRTKENEAWFSRVPKHRRRHRQSSRRRKSTQKRKQQPAAPQVWLTVMWHVGLGLLWDWRQGPSGCSERAHLQEMLDELPEQTLVVADAGFQGYEYWQSLIERDHSFLIRVAGNVRLLRGLGYVRRRKQIAYLWPDAVRRRKQPPIVLRLFEFHDGRRSVWLATNVLDPGRLSSRQALKIYHLRWGVELFIRGFKQTFGRGKLRSRAPQNVELELHWSLIGLWCLELLAVRELLARSRTPCDLSTAGALRAVRQALQSAAAGVDFDLCSQLAAIRHDGYRRRQKSIRSWPKKKTTIPAGPPQLSSANTEQIKTANELRNQAA